MNLRSSHSIAVAALILAGGSLQALAADVSLDDLTLSGKNGGSVTIKHVEFDGTNLSKDEIATLFSDAATRETIAPIIAKLQATKILIPEMIAIGKDAAGTLTFHDFQAAGVNAGKFDHASISGFDGNSTMPNVGLATIHSGAVAMDGGDFSRLLPALRDGNLASAGGAKINHFSWQGFTMTFPDKETPVTAAGGNLYKIAMASIEGQSTYDGDYPAKGSGQLKDLTIEPPKASQFGQALTAFGYDRIDIGFALSGSYDADAETYVLDDYTISGVNAGTLDIKAQFGGIDKSAFSGDRQSRAAALANGNVSSAAVSFVNNGLFEKTVAFVAKSQKATPDAIKQQWSAMTTQLLPLLLGGDPAAIKLVTAVTKFIAAPKNLTIAVKAKGDPIPFSEITTAAPAELLQHINLDAAPQ